MRSISKYKAAVAIFCLTFMAITGWVRHGVNLLHTGTDHAFVVVFLALRVALSLVLGGALMFRELRSPDTAS